MSTVLSIGQEAVIVAFRRHTLLPLDDCLYALQATIPDLRAPPPSPRPRRSRPYRIHIALTDNGIQFADLPQEIRMALSLVTFCLETYAFFFDRFLHQNRQQKSP